MMDTEQSASAVRLLPQGHTNGAESDPRRPESSGPGFVWSQLRGPEFGGADVGGKGFYFGAGERGAPCAGGAGSLPGLHAPQSPSRDPSREGRPERVGGGGRGGGRLPHRRLWEALLCSLTRAAGWGSHSGCQSERKTEEPSRREALLTPKLRCGTLAARRSDLGALGCPQRLQSRCGVEEASARGAPGLFSPSFGIPGAARASAVSLLDCPSALPLPAQFSGLASPGPGCSRGDEESSGAGAHGAGRAGRTARRRPMRLLSNGRGPWGAACGWPCWAPRAWARRPSSASSCSVTILSATSPQTDRASTVLRCCSMAPSTT